MFENRAPRKVLGVRVFENRAPRKVLGLRVFENRAPRKVFECDREQVPLPCTALKICSPHQELFGWLNEGG